MECGGDGAATKTTGGGLLDNYGGINFSITKLILRVDKNGIIIIIINMKKLFTFLLIILSLLCLNGCMSTYINDFNDNFNGEYKLADIPPTDSSESFEYMGGFGCYLLISRDGATEGTWLTEYCISGYPDCLDDYKVTDFKTKDAKYKIFDFSVGDSMEKGESALSSHGYKSQKTETTGWGVSYKRGKIGISLYGTDTITMIWVQLDTTNKTGAIF